MIKCRNAKQFDEVIAQAVVALESSFPSRCKIGPRTFADPRSFSKISTVLHALVREIASESWSVGELRVAHDIIRQDLLFLKHGSMR
jgi:hypothetical protein